MRGCHPIEREEFDQRVKCAERYLFSLGVGDVAEEVGGVNATLFLAKIHYIQEQLGCERHAMVIGAPDFTFQTSAQKFRNAVPEGAKIIWGDDKYEFIPGEIDVDFCGMLVAGVEGDPGIVEVLDKLYELKEDDLYIGNLKIRLENFGPGSHFLNIYRVDDHEALNLPEKLTILHTSSDEMRDPLRDFVQTKAEKMWTPFGSSYVLQGSDAREYERRCRDAVEFAKVKRELLFKKIFGAGEIIANHSHYELKGLNRAVIGCTTIDRAGELHVMASSDGLPAYLMKGKMNLSPEKIEEIGFNSRTLEGWVYEELMSANLLPHGGGHRLIEADGISRVILYPNAKVIIPTYHDKSGTTAYSDFETIQRHFRVDGVLEKTLSLELAEHYATLRFVYGIKTGL